MGFWQRIFGTRSSGESGEPSKAAGRGGGAGGIPQHPPSTGRTLPSPAKIYVAMQFVVPDDGDCGAAIRALRQQYPQITNKMISDTPLARMAAGVAGNIVNLSNAISNQILTKFGHSNPYFVDAKLVPKNPSTDKPMFIAMVWDGAEADLARRILPDGTP
jgi:hypothetical protein